MWNNVIVGNQEYLTSFFRGKELKNGWKKEENSEKEERLLV